MEQNRRSNAADAGPILGALSVERRRQVLEYLLAADGGATTLSAVADHLCARRDGADAEAREAILNRLHHTDLPVLDAAGLLSYDANETTVRIRERETDERPSGMHSGVDSWHDLLDRLRALSGR